MANDFYNVTTDLQPFTRARSGVLDAEFAGIATGFGKLPSESRLLSGNSNFVAAGGTANAIAVSAPTTWTSYTGKDGYVLSIKIATTNTGTVTLNVDSLGAKVCVRNDGTALQAGDLQANGVYGFVYNSSDGKFHVNAYQGIVTDATAQADAAAASATNAATSESNAASSASSASTSASNAATSETNASGSATTSTNYATKTDGFASGTDNSSKSWAVGGTGDGNPTAGSAKDWATKAEDSLVDGSGYSAKHHAAKASASASAAATSEANAANSASSASTSASNAATSETNAASSASAASTSETNAANSASAASTSESNAASSATAAAQSYDDFDDRYLGPKSSEPTTDNDGNPLQEGALYWNTTTKKLRIHDGSAWTAAAFDTNGALVAANNLSDLDDAPTARTNLGLAAVAASGAYGDLSGKPGTATSSTDGLMASADKSKLDGIESGATADQTKADIDALGINADTVDGKHAADLQDKLVSGSNIKTLNGESLLGSSDISVGGGEWELLGVYDFYSPNDTAVYDFTCQTGDVFKITPLGEHAGTDAFHHLGIQFLDASSNVLGSGSYEYQLIEHDISPSTINNTSSAGQIRPFGDVDTYARLGLGECVIMPDKNAVASFWMRYYLSGQGAIYSLNGESGSISYGSASHFRIFNADGYAYNDLKFAVYRKRLLS
ncbi:hypothetical protein EQG41_18340 [Billgrantia azerbaijanica]|nr:hypothetical protein EQG41_18340 [Halomonas azerbaijanica]